MNRPDRSNDAPFENKGGQPPVGEGPVPAASASLGAARPGGARVPDPNALGEFTQRPIVTELQERAVEVLKPHVPEGVGATGSTLERLAAQVAYLSIAQDGWQTFDFRHGQENCELTLKKVAAFIPEVRLEACILRLGVNEPHLLVALTKDDLFDDALMNPKRIAWGERALAVFAKDTGLNLEVEGDAALADLLADLRHYADAKGLDFEDAYESGMSNYHAEIREAAAAAPPAPAVVIENLGALSIEDSNFVDDKKVVIIQTKDECMAIHDPFSSCCGRFRVDPRAEWGVTPEMVKAWWEKVQELDQEGLWDKGLGNVNAADIEDWLAKNLVPPAAGGAPDRSRASHVTAKISCDDIVATMQLDVTAYLETSGPESIQKFADHDWNADDETDDMADFFRLREPQFDSYMADLDAVRRESPSPVGGINIQIDPAEAEAWVVANRPDIKLAERGHEVDVPHYPVRQIQFEPEALESASKGFGELADGLGEIVARQKAFLADRGLTIEQVKQMPRDAQEKLNDEWKASLSQGS